MSFAISAIVPVFNRAHYLRECVGSILAQTIPCAEIVIVDDASTDDSVRVAEELAEASPVQVKILKHEVNRGIAATRNTAVEAATEEWIALLDSDDLWLPEKNAVQIEALAGNPEAKMCSSSFEEFFSPDYTPLPGEKLKADLGVLSCSMLIHRSVFDAVGPFETDLRAGEFIEWLMRARTQGVKEVHDPRRLFRRRVHARNTVRSQDTNANYLHAVRLVMAGKRAAGKQ